MSYDTTSTPESPPVTDWLNDWDWLDPQWGPNAIDIWNSVREQGCPMAFTERYGRAWMPVTMEAVTAVAHDTETFSSQWVSVARPDVPCGPAHRSRPIRRTTTAIAACCCRRSGRRSWPRWNRTCATTAAGRLPRR